MILSTYDPNGQGSCPFCKKVVKVYIHAGFLRGSAQDNMSLECMTCHGQWRVYLYSQGMDAMNIVIIKKPIPTVQEEK